MAPMTSEPASARPRRQAFVATCSPDELLGQVIQTLCPRYNIDAPHLLALRQLLSSTIVAPRKPPTLKRTRPDKRIGEIGSIYDTSRRSPFGPNGPPVSASQSFYFHHHDADFERLLPRVDRSRYVWRDEPDSQSDSDTEKVSDNLESSQSQIPAPETLATERKRSTQSTTPIVPASASSNELIAEKVHPQGQESLAQEQSRLELIQEPVSKTEKPSFPESGPETPRKNASANSLAPQRPSVPMIVVTTPRSTDRIVIHELENTALSSPLLPATNIAIELPDSQDMDSIPPPPYSALPFYVPRCLDTQDTVHSTQQSEVFSPPNDFVQFTPPSQDETQQEGLSQVETPNAYLHTTTVRLTTDPSKPPPRRSPRVFAPSPPVATASLGKRSREKSESSDAAPSLKRSKTKG